MCMSNPWPYILIPGYRNPYHLTNPDADVQEAPAA